MAKPPTPPAVVSNQCQTFIDTRDAQNQYSPKKENMKQDTDSDQSDNGEDKGKLKQKLPAQVMFEYITIADEDKNTKINQQHEMLQEG